MAITRYSPSMLPVSQQISDALEAEFLDNLAVRHRMRWWNATHKIRMDTFVEEHAEIAVARSRQALRQDTAVADEAEIRAARAAEAPSDDIAAQLRDLHLMVKRLAEDKEELRRKLQEQQDELEDFRYRQNMEGGEELA